MKVYYTYGIVYRIHVAIFSEVQYKGCILHLPKYGHISARNMYEVWDVYNVLSNAYFYLLVLIPYRTHTHFILSSLLGLLSHSHLILHKGMYQCQFKINTFCP